jgi:hypothetical protein
MQVEDLSKLSKDQLDEATRHFSASPDTAPEAAEAMAFQKQSLEAVKEKYLGEVRQKYTNDLEPHSENRGSISS